MTPQSLLTDVGYCCKKVPLPSKVLWTHGMCCSVELKKKVPLSSKALWTHGMCCSVELIKKVPLSSKALWTHGMCCSVELKKSAIVIESTVGTWDVL